MRLSVQRSAREDDQPDRHRHQAQLVDGRLADDDRAAQRLGRRQRDLRRPPDDLDQLLADDRAAERDQDLLQVLAVDRPDDDALEAEAEGAGDEHRRQRGDEDGAEVEAHARRAGPAAEADEDAGRDVGAERDEEAVAEVQHVHQAEDERQPRGGDEDDHSHRQAGDGQREPGRRRADRRPGDEREDDDERHRHQVEAALRDRVGGGRRGGGGGGGAGHGGRREVAVTGARRARGRAAAAAAPRRRRARPSCRDGRRGRLPSRRRGRRARARPGSSARRAAPSSRCA